MAGGKTTRKAGILTIIGLSVLLLSMGAAASNSLERVLEPDLMQEKGTLTYPTDCHPTCADATVDVLDSPPRYSDSTTGLPTTVVQSGGTVRWQWEGGMFHSVTSDPDLSVGGEHFDSGVQRFDGNGDPYTFEATFSEPGVYKVFCMVHGEQHGALVVV